MPSVISRGPITDRLIAELNEEGFPVGDNSSPDSPYGWSGEPNTGTFTPWMTITTLSGVPQQIPGAIGDTGTEWNLPYAVFYAGKSRRQCEALADKIRNALVNIERERVSTPHGDGFRIMKISCSTVGAVNRIGTAYPDYYTQSDNFQVLVSKERA